MTDVPFTYENYESARKQLIAFVNAMVSEEDRAFLVSFEEGNPHWEKSGYSNFREFPSVQWKLQNVIKLKRQNSTKHKQEVNRLMDYFEMK
jgi:hypothetical protein